MRAALEKRNREITAKVDKLFQDRLGASGPTWEDVVALTPRGNATERHVAYAMLLRLRESRREAGKVASRNHDGIAVGQLPRQGATMPRCKFSSARNY